MVEAIGGHWWDAPIETVGVLKVALHSPEGGVQAQALKALSMIVSARHDEDLRCSEAQLLTLQAGIRRSLQ